MLVSKEEKKKKVKIKQSKFLAYLYIICIICEYYVVFKTCKADTLQTDGIMLWSNPENLSAALQLSHPLLGN